MCGGIIASLSSPLRIQSSCCRRAKPGAEKCAAYIKSPNRSTSPCTSLIMSILPEMVSTFSDILITLSMSRVIFFMSLTFPDIFFSSSTSLWMFLISSSPREMFSIWSLGTEALDMFRIFVTSIEMFLILSIARDMLVATSALFVCSLFAASAEAAFITFMSLEMFLISTSMCPSSSESALTRTISLRLSGTSSSPRHWSHAMSVSNVSSAAKEFCPKRWRTGVPSWSTQTNPKA
mmetsp:Transcript_58313/g.164640  ORF Transcript_58313/g.164640 Transcript_58313/m.164640 type:complete len:235 (+) Transcript_58313:644-1348(+)